MASSDADVRQSCDSGLFCGQFSVIDFSFSLISFLPRCCSAWLVNFSIFLNFSGLSTKALVVSFHEF